MIMEALNSKRITSTMSVWDCLHEDILDQILDQVVLLSDFIRFGAVCKTWYSVFLHRKRHRIQRCKNEFPFLCIPPPYNLEQRSYSNNLSRGRNRFDILRDKYYRYLVPGPVAKIYGSSSSYGWLISVVPAGTEHTNIILNSPDTGNTISLPLAPTQKIYDVVLSCDPCKYPDECVVAYLSGFDRSGFMRLGGNTWTIFSSKDHRNSQADFPLKIRPGEDYNFIKSILFHKGELYGLDMDSRLFAFGFASNGGDRCDFLRRSIVSTYMADMRCRRGKLYLVESARGDLLMIVKDNRSSAILVHKLVISYDDLGDEKGVWVEIDRLGNGDEVLFMSDWNVVCVLASRIPSLQHNSVYRVIDVTNATTDRYYEIRMFRLDSSEMQQGEYKQSLTIKELDARLKRIPPSG